MIKKGLIKKSLTEIDILYRRDVTGAHATHYAKLAHLELCGWIEQAQDKIVETSSSRFINDTDHKRDIKNIIKKNSNMDYSNNFKKMLIEVIGRCGVEKLEKKVSTLNKDILESELLTLKNTRNAHAHTHTKECTMTLDSPGTNIVRFERIFTALKDYERTIKVMRM
ncbi:MAG: hypothetical protein HRT52_20000 [Colwellia sp.]|nr:hypothetical protein [Colwellia sp.]NQZ83295.1 hypothetical protein [Colwellia sp.]